MYSQWNRNLESVGSAPSIQYADWLVQITRLTKGKALGRDKTNLRSEVTKDGQRGPSVVLPRGMSEQSKIFI